MFEQLFLDIRLIQLIARASDEQKISDFS